MDTEAYLTMLDEVRSVVATTGTFPYTIDSLSYGGRNHVTWGATTWDQALSLADALDITLTRDEHGRVAGTRGFHDIRCYFGEQRAVIANHLPRAVSVPPPHPEVDVTV